MILVVTTGNCHEDFLLDPSQADPESIKHPAAGV
jgi:hypothetical protein